MHPKLAAFLPGIWKSTRSPFANLRPFDSHSPAASGKGISPRARGRCHSPFRAMQISHTEREFYLGHGAGRVFRSNAVGLFVLLDGRVHVSRIAIELSQGEMLLHKVERFLLLELLAVCRCKKFLESFCCRRQGLRAHLAS